VTKVVSIGDKKPLCPYCGKVPADQHPEYSCPRISAIEIDGTGVLIHFMPAADWAVFLKECAVD
jgi:hypothetical protein